MNKYMQVIPVKKTQGLYMQMTIEEAGRIQQTDLSNFIWADGQPAAEGNDGSELFAWLTFRTTRFNFPVLLGDKTVDQSDWNITAQYSSIKARQAMTARTVLSVTAMTNTNNYPSTHWLDISSGRRFYGNGRFRQPGHVGREHQRPPGHQAQLERRRRVDPQGHLERREAQ